MKKSCFVGSTSPWADDMYVGVCLHDAGVTNGEEPCIFNHQEGIDLFGAAQMARCAW